MYKHIYIHIFQDTHVQGAWLTRVRRSTQALCEQVMNPVLVEAARRGPLTGTSIHRSVQFGRLTTFGGQPDASRSSRLMPTRVIHHVMVEVWLWPRFRVRVRVRVKVRVRVRVGVRARVRVRVRVSVRVWVSGRLLFLKFSIWGWGMVK